MTLPAQHPATRAVRESQHETSELMMPQHANVLGHVFGGVILSMMDTTAAVAAFRHARNACVTVSIDRVDFREPVHPGDLLIMKASVNYVGRSSMEIGVRVEAEDLMTGDRYMWQGPRNYVELNPAFRSGHILKIHRRMRVETDFEYFL
jgi:acyl-CoA hydrolase